MDNVWDLQAGHSTYVAGMIYARELQQGMLGTAARRDKFRGVSRQWYRFLGFGAGEGGQETVGSKRKRELFDSVREEARFRRFVRLRIMNIGGALRTILGEKAEFRGI